MFWGDNDWETGSAITALFLKCLQVTPTVNSSVTGSPWTTLSVKLRNGKCNLHSINQNLGPEFFIPGNRNSILTHLSEKKTIFWMWNLLVLQVKSPGNTLNLELTWSWSLMISKLYLSLTVLHFSLHVSLFLSIENSFFLGATKGVHSLWFQGKRLSFLISTQKLLHGQCGSYAHLWPKNCGQERGTLVDQPVMCSSASSLCRRVSRHCGPLGYRSQVAPQGKALMDR